MAKHKLEHEVLLIYFSIKVPVGVFSFLSGHYLLR